MLDVETGDAGFTTVRNLGHSGIDGDITLRDQIGRGLVSGPRLLAAGRKITPLRGQGVARLSPDDAIPETGVYSHQWNSCGGACRRRSCRPRRRRDQDRGRRRQSPHDPRRNRSDRPRGAPGTPPGGGACDLGRGHPGVYRGGVDSIEHGNEATDAMLTAMREKGIALVPMTYTSSQRPPSVPPQSMPRSCSAGGIAWGRSQLAISPT